MKAFIYTRYGTPETLQLVEKERPVPKPDQVLLKVCAASINSLDWRFMKGKPFAIRLMFGVSRPSLLPGRDVAGIVEAVGDEVKSLKKGDEVFGTCLGSFAEYAVTSEQSIACKPVNITFEEAAAVPVAALTALQGLRDAGSIQRDQHVLIDGAGGGVGTFAVQLAKAFGTEVTATCSTRNMEVIKTLGADFVIDYTKDHFNRYKRRYDLILAANGYHSLFDYKKALKPKGNFVMAGGSMSLMFVRMLLAPWIKWTEGKKMKGVLAKVNAKDLATLGEMLQSGQIRPVIDQQYPMSDLVKAMWHMDKGHLKGKVVLAADL